MKKFISMIIILLLIIMTMISYTSAASNTYSVNMYLEDTQYKQGDTIYIPVKLEDIDIEQGVVAFNTIIEYDNVENRELEYEEQKQYNKALENREESNFEKVEDGRNEE